MPDIPPEAVEAAVGAYRHALMDRPTPTALSDEQLMREVLEAAAPIFEDEFGTWLRQQLRDNPVFRRYYRRYSSPGYHFPSPIDTREYMRRRRKGRRKWVKAKKP